MTQQVQSDPVQEIQTAVATLERMADAALVDLKGSKYWNFDPAKFTQGIDNACGGAAGQLAALFTPVVATATRKLLADAAGQIGETNYDCADGCDACGGHTWPSHNHWMHGCEGFISVHGSQDGAGEWCRCAQINEALTAARAINKAVEVLS